jgi:hypothetical protein
MFSMSPCLQVRGKRPADIMAELVGLDAMAEHNITLFADLRLHGGAGTAEVA